jgi:glycosyltransferase involved in cell wall biosynthesis
MALTDPEKKIEWLNQLTDFPYAASLIDDWQKTDHSQDSHWSDYEAALDAYFISKDNKRPLANRYVSLIDSRERFLQLSAKGDTHLATQLTLIRIYADLDEIQDAINGINQILQDMPGLFAPALEDIQIKIDRPFLAPLSDYDAQSVQGSLSQWLQAAIIDALDKYSTTINMEQAEEHQQRLSVLQQNPNYMLITKHRSDRHEKSSVKQAVSAALSGQSMSAKLKTFGARKKLVRQTSPGKVIAASIPTEPGDALRVLHLATLESGGAGVAAYRLHRGLRKIGINSVMSVLHKSSNDPSVHWIHGVQDSDVNPQAVSLWPHLLQQWGGTLQRFPDRSRSLCFFSTPDSNIALEQQVKNFNVINMHWVAGLVDIQRMPEIFAGKKLFWTLHDMNPFTGGCHYAQDCTRYETGCHDCPQLGPGPEDIVHNIWNIKQESYRKLDLTIVTPSRWLGDCSQKSALFRSFPHRVIPYGLDLEDYSPMDSSLARQQLGLSKHAKIILFGASAVSDYRKGFDLFLNAITHLPRFAKGIKIILAAFGQSKDLSCINSPYPLHSLGHLNTALELRTAYSAADVFVIPTREDNLPNTVLESLACGTPVVAFNLGGLPDMIVHRQTGYLAPFPDVEDMARGIYWIIQQNALEFQQNCRQFVIQNYELKTQAENYAFLYSEKMHKIKEKTRQSSSSQFLHSA